MVNLQGFYVRWGFFDFVAESAMVDKKPTKNHGGKKGIPNFTKKTHIKIPSRVGKTNPVTKASFFTSQSFPQQKQKPTTINNLQKKSAHQQLTPSSSPNKFWNKNLNTHHSGVLELPFITLISSHSDWEFWDTPNPPNCQFSWPQTQTATVSKINISNISPHFSSCVGRHPKIPWKEPIPAAFPRSNPQKNRPASLGILRGSC